MLPLQYDSEVVSPSIAATTPRQLLAGQFAPLWAASRSALQRVGASTSALEKVVMLSALEKAGESFVLVWEMRWERP